MSSDGDPSRRVFLQRAAAVAAVAAVPGVVAGCDQAGRPVAARRAAASRPVPENSLPGDPDWWIRDLGAPDAIMGYAGQSSVLPGQPVDLYVSTTSREFQVSAFRMGWYGGALARKVWASGALRGHQQRAAGFIAETNTVHTDWGSSVTVPTDGWPAGSYLLRLDAHSGGQRYVPLTVRSASTKGKVVLKNGVATWQAYNTWGGYDLYNGPTGAYGNRSLAVSLDRPYDQEGAYLFMVYERKLINLAERMGLPLAYLTSMDIARDPHALDGASALVSPGHDEYWSPPERANVTAARDGGVNLAFLGANAMFRRTRLEPTALGPCRLVICYRTSYQQDPMYGKDNALVTSDWRDPPAPDPESSVIGTLYEGYPTVADYVVASPDAWMFRGTGARLGTSFRALIGIEYDRVNPGYPVQRPIQVLSHSPLTCNGVNSYADSAYYTHRGGAGVFNAGTMRWVESFGPPLYGWGITRKCGDFTRRVTANVLRAFADGPAAARYPAHDNLAAMHEWPGDPLAADHNLWPPVQVLSGQRQGLHVDRQRPAGRRDHGVHGGALCVQGSQVALQPGPGAGPGPEAAGGELAPDVGLHPHGIGRRPGDQPGHHPAQAEAGQRLRHLVLEQVVQQLVVGRRAIARPGGRYGPGGRGLGRRSGLDRPQRGHGRADVGRARSDVCSHVGHEAAQVGGPLGGAGPVDKGDQHSAGDQDSSGEVDQDRDASSRPARP